MIYMLELLGLLAVAFSLAASPVLVNLLEHFFPPLEDDGRTATGNGSNSALTHDRAEMRDEIRRVTNMLENKNLDIRNSSNAAGHTLR
jgi:hypothetical protein